MEDYVTVVSVDNGAENIKPDSRSNSQINFELDKESQFVTVLSINDNIKNQINQPEEVIVYRLPGERLGFGLKFQGGSKSIENIERLFIQSCAKDSPASRANTSWGHLTEGDEILQIDGFDVKTMTRMECVRYLKENNLAIKLNVRNIKDVDNGSDELIEKKDKNYTLPPTPAAPPRKINKRKSFLKIENETKDVVMEKPLTPPPDAEYYVNLFSDENENARLRDYESDDTASTISTVVDNFSIHSNSDLSLPNFNPQTAYTKLEISKALKSFAQLEKEFNVENRLKSDDYVTNIKPPVVFQDDATKQIIIKNDVSSIEIKGDSIFDGSLKNSDYENVDVTSKTTKRNYENVEFNRTIPYPTPLPRRGITENNKITPIIIPKVRLIGTDEVDGVHECNINTDDLSKEDDKENELPKLVKCVPKMSLAEKFKMNVNENEKIAAVVKQCIKIEQSSHEICSSSDEDDVENANNLLSDDDSDKLGPPEFVDGPGPSEVYFNYHWASNALPTIGEVEEEFSSLDMNKGPIVIINKVEELVNTNAESTIINQSITVPPKHLQKISPNTHRIDKQSIEIPSNASENIQQKFLTKSEVIVKVCNSIFGKELPRQKDKIQSRIVSTVNATNNSNTNELVGNQTGSQHTESIKNNSKIPIKFNSNNNHKSVIIVEKSNKINSNLNSGVDHNEILSERNGSTPNIVIVKNGKENLHCRNFDRNSEQNNFELIKPSVSEPKLNHNITSTAVIAERIILGTESLSATQTPNGHDIKMDKINNEIKIGSPLGMDRDNITISKQMITSDIQVSPPTFSRLPPDGHEFPPNFSEPIIITSVFKQNADVKLGGGEKLCPSDDAPSPPKSTPPQIKPRKIYRQDLVITVDDARFDQVKNVIPIASQKNVRPNVVDEKTVYKTSGVNSNRFASPSDTKNQFYDKNKIWNEQIEEVSAKKSSSRKQYTAIAPSNWRKDEKSEKSVRDKIAMFSNDNDKQKPVLAERKSLNKSTENLLSENVERSRKHSDEDNSKLFKKAQSYDTLDTIDSTSEINFTNNIPITESTCDSKSSSKKIESSPSMVNSYIRAYSVENLRDVDNTLLLNKAPTVTNRTTINATAPIIPSSYASLPRSKPPTITRTTSFSGSRENQSYDERRRTSINNLLEQRKKSMSKLRGLIIPEKTTGETEQILDLPEIKSADTQKVPMLHLSQNNSYSRREPVVPNPRHYTSSYQSLPTSQENGYVSIFGNGTNRTTPRTGRSTEVKTIFAKPAIVTPPTKPPRTSLIIASQQTTKENNKCDDSEDSDSVFCAKISSPPHSPVTNPPNEKISLTRTLSSETNTSIASSTTSTLTSGSGSQASCSSAGSTPTIDMSRKIIRSSSKDSYVNRKNILALSKCRSGKDDTNGRLHQRYEDEDSTDGCEEDVVRHIPKSKQRSAQSAQSKVSIDSADAITNYRLVSSENAVVDMIVKVAEFVEITSDSNSDSVTGDTSPAKVNDKFIDEERRASFKASVQEAKIVKTVPKVVPIFQSKQSENSNDLAKWVRSEAAKTRKVEEIHKTLVEKPKPAEQPKVPVKNTVIENIKKFNNSAENKPLPLPSSALNTPKKSQWTDNRKTNDNKFVAPVKSPKNKFNNHERFSSLDSLASSSSGVSSTQTLLTNTPEHGSFSSFESNHSLITPADLQLIIEEADPPLKTPEAIVIVLYRESPQCSVGVTLAGGADYETKEITVHCILANSPAYKDGRLRKGDRILSINGLSMRGLTHRESVTVLKSPRTEVVMVITRSESVKVSNDLGSSMGSLNSLCDKPFSHLDGNRRRTYHKVSKSLDLDVDGVSNEGSIFDDCKSLDDRENNVNDANFYGSTDRSTKNAGILNNNSEGSVKIIEVLKDSCGLGLAIEGGLDSPSGHKPLTVKKVFMGGAAEKAGNINVGDVILTINDFCTKDITRVQAWNYMKGLPSGPVKFVLR